MKLAWIDSSRIIKGFRLVKTRITAKHIEETKTTQPFGHDSVPTKNYLAIVANTQGTEDPIIVGYLNPQAIADLQHGESCNYSTNSNGEIQATIKFRSDGTLELLGNTDNMVRYSELEKAFNQLKSDFNTFVTDFNSHTHLSSTPGTPTGPASTSTPPITATPTQADITPSKIDEIKTI